jgi:hypothetical protein
LRRREQLFWLCAGAALVVLVLSLIPSHYEICEVAEKTKEEHCARYQVAQFLGIKVPQILDRMGGVLTALATLAIAAFTLTLKRATDRLWDAGERQLKLAADTAAAQSHDMQASIKAAEKAADAAKLTAEAAKVAADIAKSTLIETDRPWISINAEIDGPLIFGPEEIEIPLKITLKNIGRSPATHVQLLETEMCPNIVRARSRGEDIARTYVSALLGYGIVLFPGNEFISNDIYDIKPKMLRAEFIEHIRKLAADLATEGIPVDHERPALMVPVFYNLAGEHKSRHTILLFEIRNKDPKHPGWDGSEQTTPVDDLNLVQSFMSGKVT